MPKIIIVLGLIALIVLVIIYKLGYLQPAPVSNNVPRFKGLIFSSKDDERRMKTLDSCINNMYSTGWQSHEDYKEIGNFYQATWGNGGNKVKLFTTEYKLPQVSGVGLEVNFVPDKLGWGVNFSFVTNVLESITNDRFQVIFDKFAGANGISVAQVFIGSGNEYKIYDTSVSVDSTPTLKYDLNNYTTSAQNLRDLSLKQLSGLHQGVIEKINSDTITHCLALKRRDPLPPECIKKGILNDQEKADELKKADEYFKSQQEMVQADYQAMYDVLMKALPPKSCLVEGL